MTAHAEVYRRDDGLWDWRIVNDGNHEIEATSGGQGFTERNDAKEALLRVADRIPTAVFTFDIEYPDDDA